MLTGLNEFRPGGDAVEESTTGGVYIKAKCIFHACFIGGNVGGVWKDGVTGYRSTDNQIDIQWIGIRFF